MVLDDIRDMTDVVELYFASRDLDKARSYSETYGGSGYFGSYEEAARDPRVQAMYFFTPHDLHLDSARLAVRHNKHILMEKPIARTMPEARELMKVAEDGGVKLMIAENFRFLPLVNKSKALIAQGTIGELRSVQLTHEGYDAGVVGWRTRVGRNGGGRFIDGGVHYVDMMVNLAGFPKSVFAVFESPKAILDHEGEDGVVMIARLPSGVTGLVHHSGGTPVGKPFAWVKVTGSKGVLSFAPMASELILETREDRTTVSVEPARRGVRGMVREFRDSIVEEREPIMSGQEALNDLAVVLAAYRSAEQGTVVNLAEQ